MTKAIEFRKLCLDDLTLKPKHFQRVGKGYTLGRHYVWGIIFPNGDEDHPVYYSRNMQLDKYRACGIIKLADRPLESHTEAHISDIATRGMETSLYQKVSDDPVVYHQGTDVPYSDLRFMENHATWKETDVLDLNVEYWPYALFMHKETGYGIEYFHQNVTYTGTYEGKEVKGLACFDRSYIADDIDVQTGINKVCDLYVFTSCSGIRQDGRKEMFYAVIGGENGENTVGIYWLEGEEAIISENVMFEAEWIDVPYLPKDDPTCGYINAVWKIENKEIHMNGKWGCSGLTDSNLVNRVGTTRTFGTWYEGKEPYEFKYVHNCNENMGCTIENLKKHGFNVKR